MTKKLTEVQKRELIEILREYCVALDMSDSEHESFADSCADVVECLWFSAEKARRLLATIDGK